MLFFSQSLEISWSVVIILAVKGRRKIGPEGEI